MEMFTELFKEVFTTYGPAAIPWMICVAAGYFLWKERRPAEELIKPYHEFMDSYKELVEACHDSIRENTKVIERLSVLIEERTRRQNEHR